MAANASAVMAIRIMRLPNATTLSGPIGPRMSDRIIAPSRGMGSGPDEIRVHGLQPVAASPPLIEAALSLRHDAFEAKLACLGEHDHALDCERFAEQDAVDAGHQPHERLPPRLEDTGSQSAESPAFDGERRETKEDSIVRNDES